MNFDSRVPLKCLAGGLITSRVGYSVFGAVCPDILAAAANDCHFTPNTRQHAGPMTWHWQHSGLNQATHTQPHYPPHHRFAILETFN